MIGKCISHYHILEKLDDGGMGVVFKAEDVKLDRPAALKFLPAALCDDEEAKERFIREAKAASSLDHPNICTIYEIGETDEGQLFIAMAYYEGETLHRKISRGPLPVAEAVDYVRQIASGLSKSHELDIIHRDVKPANAFVTRDGQVKILDFGLAKMLGEGVTLTGLAQGTPAYMAPERIRNEKASPRTDLWSLGVLLYEALAGRRPFTGASVAEIIANVHEAEPESLREVRPEVPDLLAAAVGRLLRKNPKARYRDCAHLLDDLAALGGNGTESDAVASLARSDKPAGRPVLAWLLRLLLPAFLLMVATALVVLVVMTGPAATTTQDAGKVAKLAVLILDSSPEEAERDLPYSIAERMTLGIARSPKIQVLSQDTVSRAVEEVGGPRAFEDSPELFHQWVRRTEADEVVVGRITRAGPGLHIEVQLREAATGDVLDTMVLEVPSEEDLLPRVDDLSLGIRKRYEVPPLNPLDPDLDRNKVTTSSIEAWREYTEGIRRHREYKEHSAAALFERAIEIDPEFGMAWAKLAMVQLNLNRQEWKASARKALEFVEDLTPREASYVRGINAMMDVRSWPEAIDELQKAIEIDPRFLSARQNLAMLYHNLEHYRDSIEQGEILERYEAPYRGVYAILAENHAALGDMETARQILERASKHWPRDFALAVATGRLELRRQSFGEALKSFTAAEALEPARALNLEGWCHTHILREEWQEASDLATGPFKEPALRLAATRCRILVELHQGRSAQALALANTLAAEMPPGWPRVSLRLAAARIFLLRGEAEAVLAELAPAAEEARGHPLEAWVLFHQAKAQIAIGLSDAAEDTAEQLHLLAEASSHAQIERLYQHVSGLLALAEGRHTDAVAKLEEAARSLPSYGLFSFFHVPDHVPLWASLAAAYEQADDELRAARQREKIVRSAEERLNYPGLYVRSLYWLGTFHQTRGEELTARNYYDDFRNLWNGGDLSREWLAKLPL